MTQEETSEAKNEMSQLETLARGDACLPLGCVQEMLLGIVVAEATVHLIGGMNVNPICSWRQESVKAYMLHPEFMEQLVESTAHFGVVLPRDLPHLYPVGDRNQVAGYVLGQIESLAPQNPRCVYLPRQPSAIWMGRQFYANGESQHGDRMVVVLAAYSATPQAQARQQPFPD